jgi:hypothetical protein
VKPLRQIQEGLHTEWRGFGRNTPCRLYNPRFFACPSATAASLGDQFGLLGFADDNWVDGTQTHVFMFDAPEYRALGYGFTTTGIHEVGHHIGMSHPHDGYDSQQDIDFGPSGPFEFAWSGDESHTIMHYLSIANGFGRFDRDNAYRWETAGYLNWSNAILGDIMTHPKKDRVSSLIRGPTILRGSRSRHSGTGTSSRRSLPPGRSTRW